MKLYGGWPSCLDYCNFDDKVATLVRAPSRAPNTPKTVPVWTGFRQHSSALDATL